eukprot:Hpha_TRINITY_DN31822_c0_g1::TRINITY_DN31822_c0_g1_i1::g.29962::m.29962
MLPRVAAAAGLLACVGVTSAKVVGFTLDDESCSGLGPPYHNVSDQLAACAQYFELLNNFSGIAHGAGLRLSADAGTGWTCPGEGFPPTPYCFNISYGGKNASVAEHVLDLVDTAVLMDYDTTPAKVITRAAPYLAYANRLSMGGTEKKVVVGLAISNHGDKPEWWQTGSEGELVKLMNDVSGKLPASSNPAFDGFAVFTSSSWYNNSNANPYTGTRTGPVRLWYVDHNAVFNTSTQGAWLTWAVQRKVKGWYVAPHAGNRPLIGGPPADEAAFCSFIKAADAKGIDLEFFTGAKAATATDLPFIRSCGV